MTDPRFAKLAKLLIEYSTRMKRGERVLIEVIDVPDEFSVELMRAARKVGAAPIIEVRHSRVT
ncbi:MAG TPA: aminopeptidase, partial [Verrucomicrobiae bacterium]